MDFLKLNQLVGWFALLALLLLIPYLWMEYPDISTNKKIDYEKFTSYFSGLAFIAAGLSLLFVYHQLQEMKSNYMPDLFPVNDHFKIVDGIEHGFELCYLDINNERLNLTTSAFKDELEIYNIGMGAAKNIEIEWIYDVQKVKDFCEYYNIPPNTENKKEVILFLNKNEKAIIKIPTLYFFCYGNKYNNYSAKYWMKRSQGLVDDRPDLQLKITYSDYKSPLPSKKFKISFDAIKHKFNGVDKSIVSMKFYST